MKRITFFYVFLFCVSAQAQVNFVKITNLDEAFKQARRENKLIFIDAYTDWCGWCKELDKKVFALPVIGDSMNRHFIATRLEMEQDSIGIMLARKYAVTGFPEGIVLNADGDLVYRIHGYSPPAYYAKSIADAANPEKHMKAGGYSRSFNIAYPAFYLDALPDKGVKKKWPDTAVLNTYLSKQADLSSEQNWVVMKRFYSQMNLTQYQRVLNGKKTFLEKFGVEEYEDLVHNLLSVRIQACVKDTDMACVLKYLDELEANVRNGRQSRTYYIENFYSKNGMWEKLATHITGQLPDSTYAANRSNLNDKAWTLYEESDDKHAPELVNNDAYGEGWMIKLTGFNQEEVGGLMKVEDYKKLVGA